MFVNDDKQRKRGSLARQVVMGCNRNPEKRRSMRNPAEELTSCQVIVNRRMLLEQCVVGPWNEGRVTDKQNTLQFSFITDIFHCSYGSLSSFPLRPPEHWLHCVCCIRPTIQLPKFDSWQYRWTSSAHVIGVRNYLTWWWWLWWPVNSGRVGANLAILHYFRVSDCKACNPSVLTLSSLGFVNKH